MPPLQSLVLLGMSVGKWFCLFLAFVLKSECLLEVFGLDRHRGGCGYQGASGHVSPNAAVQLKATEKWLFPGSGDGVWVWTKCLQSTRRVHADL